MPMKMTLRRSMVRIIRVPFADRWQGPTSGRSGECAVNGNAPEGDFAAVHGPDHSRPIRGPLAGTDLRAVR